MIGQIAPRRVRARVHGARGAVVALAVATVAVTGCSASSDGDHSATHGASNSPASSATGSRGAAPSSATRSGTSSGGSPATSGATSSGGIKNTVPSRQRVELAPVSLAGTARFGTGVTARLTSVQATRGEASGPGEVSGPALRVTVRVANGTSRSVSLTGALVTITDSAGTPGVQLSRSGSSPLRGNLAAGASARGTYVFTLPVAHRDPVTIDFSYDNDAPVALFVGTPQ